MRKAVIAVSFGTSHKDAWENSIDKINKDLQAVSEDIKVYQAYTSRMIIKKLGSQGIVIDDMSAALEKAKNDGARELYVVPTHMIHGFEYNKVVSACEKYKACFDLVKLTPAVLETKEDCHRLVKILNSIISFNRDYEYVLMGHGSEAEANIRYKELNSLLKEAGYTNVHIASVEAEPTLEDAIKAMRKPHEVEKVVLYPLMVVAGDHAKNDMAGSDEDSYASVLKALGYKTEPVIKGLGEFKEFRNIYVNYLNNCI